MGERPRLQDILQAEGVALLHHAAPGAPRVIDDLQGETLVAREEISPVALDAHAAID